MIAALESNDTGSTGVLYMVLELSHSKWKLGFSNGVKDRQCTIESGNWIALHDQLAKAREKLKLPADCRVVSCYEAGRDGFWIHRDLTREGITNYVIDSASIEVNRRQRRVKTDRVDVGSLLRLLIRYVGGERGMMSVVRVPSLEEEDQRRLNRERERLVKERGAHSARLKSLLVAHGVRLKLGPTFLAELSQARGGAYGYELGADLKAELQREYERYQLADEQIRHLEQEQKRRVQETSGGVWGQVNRLMQLKGVGWQSAWLLVMELFGWREFRNGKELAACVGLTPTPYSSGDSEREQGISKAGSRRVRSLMVELSWLWLRYQPNSALSRWFGERFGGGGKRMRRIGIVALARKLLIALWRYVEHEITPAGALLSPP